MGTRFRRGALTAVIAVGVLLGAASAAGATGATGATGSAAEAAAVTLRGSATELVYGQPDLNGYRRGENTVTITNTGTERIEFPTLTLPTGADELIHAELSGCPYATGGSTQFTCYLDPLAPGEARTLTVPWGTRAPAAAHTLAARLGVAANRDSAPVAGPEVSWPVTFAKLTGAFRVSATDLVYGELDRYGIRHGYTEVTITNLTDRPVQHPMLTFPSFDGDASHRVWRSCVEVIEHVEDTVCIQKPLAAGASRTAKFWFHALYGPRWPYDGQVKVDAAADLSGTVIPGTSAGASYEISSPGDAG